MNTLAQRVIFTLTGTVLQLTLSVYNADTCMNSQRGDKRSEV